MKDVDFFLRDGTPPKIMRMQEKKGLYPPRFHLELSCSPSARRSQIKIEFRGRSDLVFDILLTPVFTPVASAPTSTSKWWFECFILSKYTGYTQVQ